jgi:hypothetical protein
MKLIEYVASVCIIKDITYGYCPYLCAYIVSCVRMYELDIWKRINYYFIEEKKNMSKMCSRVGFSMKIMRYASVSPLRFHHY